MTVAVRQPPTALRAWQERALVAMDAWSEGPFLISAAPGAGKTRPALEFARRMLKAGAIRRVAVVCPTTPLTRQWAAAAARMGLHLVPDAADLRPPADFSGVAVTYARVAASAGRWATQCTPGTLVIADEAHHLGRLRVGVYATAARTPLIFRQIVGRFVRTIQGRPLDMSWLYLPADPVLRAHAGEIERELRHILHPPSEGDPYALDEPPERAESERTEPEEFVPVAADVAPQLALFGGGPAGPAPGRIVPSFASAVEEPDEAEMPAYERRALLRDKRHRLVADLRRVEGASHAEINRWLNRSTGIQRVDDASISQLERSVDLLLERLSGPRRR